MGSIFRPKVCLIGEPGVGKTCIISKWCYGMIPRDGVPTLGSSFQRKQVTIDGDAYDIEVRDTAGQEVYASLVPSYIRSAAGVIIVYSIAERDSFAKLQSWVDMATSTAPQAFLLIFGNKVDLAPDRAVSADEARQYSEARNALFFEGSAIMGEGVNEAFRALIDAWNSAGRPGDNIPLLVPQARGEMCGC
jgi:small GTP-binding protein